ncbi:hypothetical protein LguiB_033020 [Lonicera macranthoides]
MNKNKRKQNIDLRCSGSRSANSAFKGMDLSCYVAPLSASAVAFFEETAMASSQQSCQIKGAVECPIFLSEIFNSGDFSGRSVTTSDAKSYCEMGVISKVLGWNFNPLIPAALSQICVWRRYNSWRRKWGVSHVYLQLVTLALMTRLF